MTSALNQMPSSICEEYVKRNEMLLQRLTAAAGDDKEQCPIASEIDSGEKTAQDTPGIKQELACPMMTIEESSRLTISWKELSKNPDKARAIFDEFGVMIVTGVCNKEETEIQEELWKSDLLALAGDSQISRHPNGVQNAYRRLGQKGPRSWPKSTFLGKKFASFGGLSHGAYAWACRTNLKVRKVFSELYQDDDLLVGVDNVFFSSEKSAPLKANEYWLHADQSTKTDAGDILCIQSVLYTWSSETPDASTTVVCPGSHKGIFDKMMKFSSASDHWVPHSTLAREVREDFYKYGRKEARRVPVPAGALLLWSSKVSHQGWKCGPRLAMPICWEPAKRRSEEARRRKLYMAACGIPSTHWASMGKIHPMAPRKMKPALGSDSDVPSAIVQLPLYPSIVPFPVQSDLAGGWQENAEKMWSMRQPSDAETAKFEQLLKPEILRML
eukprot:TRINITY_DN342_c0_g1_i2.p1 TRINITY_DN342_c0_g1~~TRINITY_DN342_c0_g1_i2.p1  ORF type:complete len:464 (+),score=90.17 TRINITY_DN342_c0_g1_i2:64-1392(+)